MQNLPVLACVSTLRIIISRIARKLRQKGRNNILKIKGYVQKYDKNARLLLNIVIKAFFFEGACLLPTSL